MIWPTRPSGCRCPARSGRRTATRMRKSRFARARTVCRPMKPEPPKTVTRVSILDGISWSSSQSLKTSPRYAKGRFLYSGFPRLQPSRTRASRLLPHWKITQIAPVPRQLVSGARARWPVNWGICANRQGARRQAAPEQARSEERRAAGTWLSGRDEKSCLRAPVCLPRLRCCGRRPRSCGSAMACRTAIRCTRRCSFSPTPSAIAPAARSRLRSSPTGKSVRR